MFFLNQKNNMIFMIRNKKNRGELTKFVLKTIRSADIVGITHLFVNKFEKNQIGRGRGWGAKF